MSSERNVFGEEKVLFLGRVIASISHELKNALATVHETAGLLSDILDTSVDPASEADEIRRCAGGISDGLDRAFGVIRSLNRFAHSADRPWEEIDLMATVELMVALAHYQSFAGRARIMKGEGRSVRVTTSPLLIEDLVYRILETAYRTRGSEAEITILVHTWSGGAEVCFIGLSGESEEESLPEGSRPILKALSAEAVTDRRRGVLRIRLPATAGGSSDV